MVEWLKAGDLNTRYFHRRTTMRRQRNMVVKLKDSQGDWVDNEEGISKLIADFYSDLFRSGNNDMEEVLSFVQPKINDQQN